MSPGWIRVSPGGACVVLNFIDKARRHPAMKTNGILLIFSFIMIVEIVNVFSFQIYD